MYRVFEIDTDVMYQWRDIVPTFETRITKIRNITLRNAMAEHADAVYELRGDSRDPIDGVTIDNVKVGCLHQFANNAEFVRNLSVTNVSWYKFDPEADLIMNVE